MVPGRGGQHRQVGAGQHGQAETASDDGRVRAGPARDRHRAGQLTAGPPTVGQLDEVGRVDLAADQDELSRRGRRAGWSAQVIEHGRGHLADVAGALGQVGVGQRGEHGGLGLGGRADRGDAVGSGLDRFDHGADQGGVRRVSAPMSTMSA